MNYNIMPCLNPACIAAKKQHTHSDQKCGVKDPSRSAEDQRPAHKAFIQKKMEESMANAATKKAQKAVEAAEIAVNESLMNPPGLAAFENAKDKVGNVIYKLFGAALEGEIIKSELAALAKEHPTLDLSSGFTNLCGKITGMYLAEKNQQELLEFAREVQKWTPMQAVDAAAEALGVLIADAHLKMRQAAEVAK
jgi:hypothetical protein